MKAMEDVSNVGLELSALTELTIVPVVLMGKLLLLGLRQKTTASTVEQCDKYVLWFN